MRTKIRSYLSKVSSAYAHTKEGKVEVSAIATLPTDHSTHSTPRGVSMTAAREPQKKSTKPGRLVTSISKQTLILFDEHLAVGRPMMVSSTKKQYLLDTLADEIGRKVVSKRTRSAARRRISYKIAGHLLREELIEFQEIELEPTSKRGKATKVQPSYRVLVSNKGFSLLEQGSRSKHPSAGGSRRRSHRNENEEVAA